MKRAKPKSVGGFSLLEVMVAGAILLIGISGMLAGVRSGLSIQAKTANSTTALEVAEREMERLFILPEGNDALEVGDHGPFSFGRAGQPVSSGGQFTMTYAVGTLAVAGVSSVDMTVAWQVEDREQSVSIQGFRR